MKPRAVLALGALVVAAPGVARAEVRELADRVEQAWKVPGVTVGRLPARFVYEDESVTLPLPALPAGRCTSIVVIGPRGMSFHVRIGGADEDPLDPTSSVAGAAEMVRCGPGGDYSRLMLTSDAGRGAVEVVVARANDPPRALKLVLPERTGAAAAPPGEAGGPPPMVPPGKRADGAEARARGESAARVERWVALANDDGNDLFPVALGAGCHRFEMFGSERTAQRKGRLDLDAELRAEDGQTVLAKDRSEAADVRLETCVGEPTDARLAFVGAGPQGSVFVVHASWPLPAQLPTLWGPVARARMAQALVARHVLAPSAPPVMIAQGAAGGTPTSVAVTPGSCYLALGAIAQGAPRGIGMRVVVGGTEIVDERGPADDAGLLAFCVGDRARVRLDVEARGAGIGWGVVVFRTQVGVWP